MKRRLICIIFLLALLTFTTSCSNQVLRITIVVPPILVPYYEWLQEYPGRHPPSQITPVPSKPVLHGYQWLIKNNRNTTAINHISLKINHADINYNRSQVLKEKTK